jgi:hypothetical protein
MMGCWVAGLLDWTHIVLLHVAFQLLPCLVVQSVM